MAPLIIPPYPMNTASLNFNFFLCLHNTNKYNRPTVPKNLPIIMIKSSVRINIHDHSCSAESAKNVSPKYTNIKASVPNPMT